MAEKKNATEAARLAKERAEAGKPTSQGSSRKRGAQKSPPDTDALFTQEEVLEALRDNEQGDGRLVAQGLKGRYLFDHKRKQFFNFLEDIDTGGGFWRYDLVRQINPEAMSLLGRAYGQELARQEKAAQNAASKEERERAEALARELKRRLSAVKTGRRIRSILIESATCGAESLAFDGDAWNADPWKLQAQSLLIDLRTGDARPGRPGDLVNKATPTPWKGLESPCPNWRRFVSEIFDDNERLTRYVQKVLGSACVGLPSPQEFYIFWGSGGNGKGTLLETIRRVLGRDLASPVDAALFMETFHTKGTGPAPEIVDLQGRRIVWASETKKGQRLNAEKVKRFTGGDTLSGRLNHSNEIIVFDPTHTLFFLTNFKPRVDSDDAALWRRLRLIPFCMEFVHHPEKSNQRQRIDGLDALLVEEAPGIQAWLVEGCILWQREGLDPPPEVLEAMEDYRLNEDPIQQFINERCLLSPGARSQAKPLHEAYTQWHIDTYGPKSNPANLRQFTDKLRLKFERDASGRHTYYIGIGLLQQSDNDSENP